MSDEKNKKGLGRGLMSLFGDQENNDKKLDIATSNKLAFISDLVPNKFQPRIVFNSEKIEELARSIKQNGLIQPIAVRPIDDDKEKFEIIAGERRWLAAQKAGLHQVPIILLNASDSQSLEIAIVENIQREDLNSIEEAKGYVRLMKEFNYDHDKLAKFMGKSRSHISNTLRLLSLPEDVIELVEKGKLTAGQVRPLIGMHNAVSLARDIIRDKLSARSIENLVRQEKGRGKKTIYSRQNPDTNILLEQRLLEEKLGLKVNITNKKNNSGKVTIEYKSLEQFELLSKILKS
tara:strand:- start:137 stop:1009 length:873 start_codon:yes stop_codon:yes gene_type:complete